MSSSSINSRCEKFKAKHMISFRGTLAKPLDLSKYTNDPVTARPSWDDTTVGMTTLDNFLKNGNKSNVCYGDKWYIVRVGKELGKCDRDMISSMCGYYRTYFAIICRKNGGVVFKNELPNLVLNSDVANHLKYGYAMPSGMENTCWSGALPSSVFTIDNLDDRVFAAKITDNNRLVINADNIFEYGDSALSALPNSKDFAQLSFSCLANLLGDEVDTGIDVLNKAPLQLLDFTEESWIPEPSLSKSWNSTKVNGDYMKYAETRATRTNFLAELRSRSKKKPEIGHTFVSRGNHVGWHRSPTTLIRSKNRTFLLGQDEGTYFGCLLADHPTTIQRAFTSLTPKQARGKKNVLRQGEWFAVPVKEPMEYGNNKNVFAHRPDNGLVSLPTTTAQSNEHTLEGTILVDRDGLAAKNFVLSHSEHAELRGTSDVWYRFYENTALRSFSQENVD